MENPLWCGDEFVVANDPPYYRAVLYGCKIHLKLPNELETSLKELPEPTSHQEKRSQEDMLVEVLDRVRELSRDIIDTISYQPGTQDRLLDLIERLAPRNVGATPGLEHFSHAGILPLSI